MVKQSRRWILLVSGAVVTGAALGWISVRVSDRPEPRTSLLVQPERRLVVVPPAGLPASVPRTRAVSPAIAASAIAHVAEQGSPETGRFFWTNRQDPAAYVQLVQAALSSAEAGLATRAANTIGRCLALETGQERWRARLAENHLNLSREMLLEMQSWRDDELRLCQALDDFSRAQWLPLLRRGLAERRIGDANDLLLTHRDHPQQRLLESEVYPSLRNDAFRCHEFSLSTLYFDHLALEHALSVDERLAVWQVLKDQYEAKPDKFFYDLLRTRPPPDQGSDPAEVQRIVMTIRSHC